MSRTSRTIALLLVTILAAGSVGAATAGTGSIGDRSNTVVAEQSTAGSVSFGADSFEVTRGGIAEIVVQFSGNASTATLLVGDYETEGYQANVTVTDGNRDGRAVVRFNSYTAGSPDRTVAEAGDDADSVETTGRTRLADVLATGKYTLSVTTASDPAAAEETPDDIASLEVSARSVGDATLLTAPNSTDPSELDERATPNTSSVFDGWAVIRLEHSLEGVFQRYRFENVSSMIRAGVFDLEVVREGADGNGSRKRLSVEDTRFETVVGADGRRYIAFRPDHATYVRNGTELPVDRPAAYSLSFALTDDRLFGDDASGASVDGSFDLPTRRLTFERSPVLVENESDQTVRGETNLPSGSEVTVRIRSDSGVTPSFFNSRTVTVDGDGRFTATFDLSEQSVGHTFSVSVRYAGAEVVSADGEVVDELRTETATMTPTARETRDPTRTTSPGLGIVATLVSIVTIVAAVSRR